MAEAKAEQFSSTEQEKDLCEICHALDFKTVAAEEYHLGTLDEILSRSSRCQLCRFLASKLHQSDLLDRSQEIPDPQDALMGPRWRVGVGMRVQGFAHVEDERANTLHSVSQLRFQYNTKSGGHVLAILRPSLQPVQSIPDQLATNCFVNTDFKKLGYGRLIGQKQADPRVFREWLRLCDETHPSCRRAERRDQPARLWIVNVREKRVMQAPPDCGYVALSYVWGPVNPLRLTRENMERLQQPGALHDLREGIPQTIRDAIDLTLMLNIDFMWVDTLCIPQDDRETKQELMHQMHLVYSNAIFTIIAAAGNSANAGLPGIQPNSRDYQQEIIHIGPHIFVEVALDKVDEMGYGYQASRWRTRAWTYEEQLFSSRQLIFTEQQVYWHCIETDPAGWREDASLETTDPLFIDSMANTYVNGRLDTDRFDPYLTAKSRGWLSFKRHACEYSRRELTKPYDALNAFKGIESALKKDYPDFHWGLPELDFTRALCWRIPGSVRGRAMHRIRDAHGTTEPRESIPFPSWCWADWRYPPSKRNIPSWKREGTALHGVRFMGTRGTRKRVTTFYREDRHGRTAKIREELDDPITDDEEDDTDEVPEDFTDIGVLRCRTHTAHVFLRCYEHRMLQGNAIPVGSGESINKNFWGLQDEEFPSAFGLLDQSGDLISVVNVEVEDDRTFMKGNELDTSLKPVEAVAVACFDGSTACLLSVPDKDGRLSRIGTAEISDRPDVARLKGWYGSMLNEQDIHISDEAPVKGWLDVRSARKVIYLG